VQTPWQCLGVWRRLPVECLLSAFSCLCVCLCVCLFVCVQYKLRIRSVTSSSSIAPQIRKALAKKYTFQLTQLCLMNSLCGFCHTPTIPKRSTEIGDTATITISKPKPKPVQSVLSIYLFLWAATVSTVVSWPDLIRCLIFSKLNTMKLN